MAALGERAKVVLEGLDALAQIMLKVTGYVMIFAPLAVLGALAGTVAKRGSWALSALHGTRFDWRSSTAGAARSCGASWLRSAWCSFGPSGPVASGAGAFFIRRTGAGRILPARSRKAAYPRALKKNRAVSDRIAGLRVARFVLLPVGYSFNLDGSMMYRVSRFMFVAQAYGVEVEHLRAAWSP